MRGALVVLILLALAGAGFWLTQSDVSPPLPPAGGGEEQPGAVDPVAAQTRPRPGLPVGVVATRTEAADIDPGVLADRPTAYLRVEAHGDRQPVAGAAVRRLSTGADLAVTDEDGLAQIPLTEAAQLAVVREGYLLRLAPVRPGSDADNPQVIRLVADVWSSVRRFAFVDDEGQPLGDVFVQLRIAAGVQPVDNGRVSELDSVSRRAWSEHRMMASRVVSRDQQVHGGPTDEHVYQASDGALAVRFAVSASYELQAATPSGLVAAATFPVQVGPEPAVQIVRMAPGDRITGVVADTSGNVLPDARISLQGGDPLGLVATTGADGAFVLGPLPRGARTLLVRHDLHRPVALEGVPVPAEGQQIRLEPLPRAPLRGRVRARPGLAPIAGASVVWQIAGGGAVTVKTDADGTFDMTTAGDIASRLVVQAPNYVTYAEMVDPGAPFADYDLLPAAPAARVDGGLTGTLEGVVFGPDGFPLANASVRWRPTNFRGTPGVPGRRVLEGGKLKLSDVMTTDSSGAFVIETVRFGPGRLTLGDGRQLSLPTTAVAGQRVQGLELGR